MVPIVNQENTLNDYVRNCAHSGCNAMAKLAKVVQDIAQSVFSFIKSPLGIGCGIGVLAFSFATSFPLWKAFTIFFGSLFAGVATTMAISRLRVRLSQNKEIKGEETQHNKFIIFQDRQFIIFKQRQNEGPRFLDRKPRRVILIVR